MLSLEPIYLEEILTILKSHLKNCDIFAFGSRVSGTYQKFSDLDIVIKGTDEISPEVINSLKEAFSLSSIPISVDIVDYHAVSDQFKSVLDNSEKTLLIRL
ncbi:nucleotidyltransferase family protein [Methanospirillum stamsii]|uniref:Nucleotidyltransferase domain-containing protein n=1 Tax=Methanospirillum stamsii TaxID=1277351 RepID=A0A2V2N5V9_9EURY|nr:nucleotidyltransferase domain-containing protein [Methanospirillum stamsii]PWR73126.1 nucleotidyltransferase domain-containing protein [Methanospirillum stamsii]